MKRTILLLLSLCILFPAALCAHPRQQLGRAALAAVSGKRIKPLSNEAIERLVRSGRSRLVIQRALGVAAQRQGPELAVLRDGQIHRALLEKTWKEMSKRKYRLEEGNMLGLNSWLIVVAHRIREGIKLSQPTLKLLERELAQAQKDAEMEFKKRYQYTRFPSNYETNPAFLSLLGEAVAQRLESEFLPFLSSADRVRLLQVLMNGIFSKPVDWGELHTAMLYKDIREALKACGPHMKRVDLYGEMKKTMRDCAQQAAQEAANNSIVSVVKLRELFIDEMQTYASIFRADPAVLEEWQQFIQFFQTKLRQSADNP